MCKAKGTLADIQQGKERHGVFSGGFRNTEFILHFPLLQNIVVSGESSSSQIVLSQPTPSKKTSDWFDKTHFQNILSMEDGFYHTDPFQSISKFFPKGWFFKP